MGTDRIYDIHSGNQGTIYGLLSVDVFLVRFDGMANTVIVKREHIRPVNPNLYLPSR